MVPHGWLRFGLPRKSEWRCLPRRPSHPLFHRLYIGVFDTEEIAAMAVDTKLIELGLEPMNAGVLAGECDKPKHSSVFKNVSWSKDRKMWKAKFQHTEINEGKTM